MKLKTLEKSCQLFSQLYICKDRDRNIEEFFIQKNNSCPQWLSKNAVLWPGKILDQLHRFENVVPAACKPSATDFVTLDEAA